MNDRKYGGTVEGLTYVLRTAAWLDLSDALMKRLVHWIDGCLDLAAENRMRASASRSASMLRISSSVRAGIRSNPALAGDFGFVGKMPLKLGKAHGGSNASGWFSVLARKIAILAKHLGNVTHRDGITFRMCRPQLS